MYVFFIYEIMVLAEKLAYLENYIMDNSQWKIPKKITETSGESFAWVQNSAT